MAQVLVSDSELEGLDGLWEAGLSAAFDAYLECSNGVAAGARSEVALAAALVELGVALQRLGGTAASPADLLVADLCLARASRLLAEAADLDLQVRFARVIERLAAAAAAGEELPSVRGALVVVLQGAS